MLANKIKIVAHDVVLPKRRMVKNVPFPAEKAHLSALSQFVEQSHVINADGSIAMLYHRLAEINIHIIDKKLFIKTAAMLPGSNIGQAAGGDDARFRFI